MPSKRGPRPRLTGRRYGLDLARCWTRAKQKIAEASGLNPDAASKIAEPVARARRLAELAAPADMRLSLALTLGASAADLEDDKAGARLMLEGAHKRLGIVGLRSGDSIDEGMSERMAGFLAAWFAGTTSRPGPSPAGVIDAPPQPRALPASVDAPAAAPDLRDRNRP